MTRAAHAPWAPQTSMSGISVSDQCVAIFNHIKTKSAVSRGGGCGAGAWRQGWGQGWGWGWGWGMGDKHRAEEQAEAGGLLGPTMSPLWVGWLREASRSWLQER